MKKQYLSTIEEAVEAEFEIATLLGIVQKTKWIGIVFSPISFVVLFFFLDNLAAKLIVGGSAAILHAVYHLSAYKENFRKRLRKIIAKARGSDKPVASEYEIDESGLAFRQQGQEIKFSWDNVQSVICTDNMIKVLMEPIGIAIIPKRIFENTEESDGWVAYIENASNS